MSGSQSLDVAVQTGCVGIMSIDPDGDLVDGWTERGGDRFRTYAEIPFAWAPTDFAWAPTDDEGIELARCFRFGIQGWDVAAELPNPAHFASATRLLTDEQIGDAVPHGPDPQPYITAVQEYIDAGFTNLAVILVGDDLAAARSSRPQARIRRTREN